MLIVNTCVGLPLSLSQLDTFLAIFTFQREIEKAVMKERNEISIYLSSDGNFNLKNVCLIANVKVIDK